MRVSRVLVIFAALSGCLAAADKPVELDWKGVRQRLADERWEGRTLGIVLLDGRSVRARLVRAEENGLVIRGGNAATEQTIARSDVAAVQLRSTHGYGRLLGTLAGASLMAVAVAHPGQHFDDTRGTPYTRSQAAWTGAVTIPLGFLVGWLADRHTVELRPKP